MKKFQFLYSVLILLIPLTSRAGSLTISGISSGGFMASQMAVIYSDQFSGVATVAGGVFYCAQNGYQENLKKYGSVAFFNFKISEEALRQGVDVASLQTSVRNIPDLKTAFEPRPSNPIYQSVGICMGHPERAHGSEPQADGSSGPMKLTFVNALASAGLIAPVGNIANQRVLIYQGDADTVVHPPMAEKLQEFYRRFAVPESAIKMVRGAGGAHNFPTSRHDGINCDSEGVPYIANCKRDLAGDILQHLINRRLRRARAKADHLYRVTQVEAPPSVAPYGYLYASDFCLKNPTLCDLHVALHGCKMADSFDEDFQRLYEAKVQMTQVLGVHDYELKMRTPRMGALTFAKKSGYAEYAEDPANRVMIFFPQTQITDANYPGNPKGCWDWYGWTGLEYATNKGSETSWLIRQIQKIRQSPVSLIEGKSRSRL